MKKLLFFIVALLCLSSCSESQSGAAYELTQRLLPEHFQYFEFEDLESPNNLDVFEIESKGDRIVIRGNKELSKTVALNYYLENYCNCQVSLNYNQLKLPESLPTVDKKIRVETPFEYRYFFNYCTFGYTMPWWDYEKWAKMTDYMALKGVNMPLAMIGQEAVWERVYTKLGMERKQLDEFFVAPAHLPWGWMGNIDGLGGPLPQTWIDRRLELQQKVLKLQRSFGMTPVLQAFTGHVPKELKEIYPDAKIMQIHDWAGIPGTYFLDPSDPLFAEIGSLFIEEQTKLFGTDHLYDADCFIEVDPPSNDPEFLENTSRAIYESMAKVDPEAKWVIQGWFFFFRQSFWQKPQGEAFFKGIPEDKAILIDLYGEKNPTWDKTDAFFGQPWIWSIICNEDQKVNMSGDLQAMQNQLNRAYESEGKKNLKGIGVIPEGIGFNPILQDFIFGKAWNINSVDIKEWVQKYASRRYGSNNQDALKAWNHLLNSVYGRTRTMWSPLTTTPQLVRFSGPEEDIRHNRVAYKITEEDPFAWDFDVYELASAATSLLAASDELKDIDGYRFDLTNVYRELLFSLTHKCINELTVAYDVKDKVAFKKAKDQILKLFDDMDAITSCDENFMLGKWLKDAMAWGTTPEEEAYYNNNARTILTIWQPWESGGLRDYAGRSWNGLLSGYYKPRWELFISMLEEAMSNNKEIDRKEFDKRVRRLDYQWTHKQDVYPDKPTHDIIKEATRVWDEYKEVFAKN